jgi:hypothetical protein
VVSRAVQHAGLLLEDAVMEAPVALFTVATDSVANVSAETPAGIRVHVHKPNWPRPTWWSGLRERGRVCRVLTHIVEYVYCQPRG